MTHSGHGRVLCSVSGTSHKFLWIVTVSGETIAGVRAVLPFEASQLLTPTVRQLYVARALRLAPFERTPLEI